jgi:hypothetical protein
MPGYGRLESADALSDSFAELREFLGTEHQKSKPYDHEQVRGLKKTFGHYFSSIPLTRIAKKIQAL